MNEAILNIFNLNFEDIIWPKQINLYGPNKSEPFGCLVYNDKSRKIKAHFGNDVDTSRGMQYHVTEFGH